MAGVHLCKDVESKWLTSGGSNIKSLGRKQSDVVGHVGSKFCQPGRSSQEWLTRALFNLPDGVRTG